MKRAPPRHMPPLIWALIVSICWWCARWYSIQTLSRIKRKVRPAAGLNSDNTLSAEAMERAGSAYARLPSACRISADATASWPPPRCVFAVNAGEFLAKAQGDPAPSASDQRRRRSAPDLPGCRPHHRRRRSAPGWSISAAPAPSW